MIHINISFSGSVLTELLDVLYTLIDVFLAPGDLHLPVEYFIELRGATCRVEFFMHNLLKILIGTVIDNANNLIKLYSIHLNQQLLLTLFFQTNQLFFSFFILVDPFLEYQQFLTSF